MVFILTVLSQLLAEFDLPPSGLGKLANSIPLPLVPNADTDPRLAQYQFFFLALIAIRKLLNRVLLYLYSRGESRSVPAHRNMLTPRRPVRRFSLRQLAICRYPSNLSICLTFNDCRARQATRGVAGLPPSKPPLRSVLSLRGRCTTWASRATPNRGEATRVPQSSIFRRKVHHLQTLHLPCATRDSRHTFIRRGKDRCTYSRWRRLHERRVQRATP